MSLITRDLLSHHSSKQSKLPDLKLEKDYLQRCPSTNTNRAIDQTVSNLQDLNQPPLNLLDDTNLDLKLVSLSASSPPYTLGEVKFALERAEKEHTKKRSISMSKSFIDTHVDDETYAAGCPSCLLYVLISSRNPKCPRCNMTVPFPFTNSKKPRIDLNITI
ncbi:hypothetical protein HanRHA438_Chr03g0131871 [Helianthus annuus]|uniref:GIR1-like zinc ribbon domain-containing protein n=2 Tax=Helianthus annuus TaxID=4232 RepID=A0A251V7U1_HELAN|nr:hypothetical protein HanXRQr2_Chr03g0120031 [Helianthus annuus]KAJ0608700.1 hypothetical protein HanHA89_Chr03g0111951 [Helianthus annuus]KAJ0936493.1 hypothetical protein HanRHA438_Chr03g0131871 [Helianthus annuus]